LHIVAEFLFKLLSNARVTNEMQYLCYHKRTWS